MLGGGRRVASVAAAVMSWEAGVTYGIVPNHATDNPMLLCLYELKSDHQRTGILKAATGDLTRDGKQLLYPYVQWTPSQQFDLLGQLVVLVFAIRPEELIPTGVELPVPEVHVLRVHSMWTAGQPMSGLRTVHGCTCLPRTIDNHGNLVDTSDRCGTAGQWCDVVPGSCQLEDPFSGKVGGNYFGWDQCEPLGDPDQAPITFCRYHDDDVCDAGTPLCPEDSDFDDCHCAYEGDGFCDEGQRLFSSREYICPWGSDSSDCCPSVDDGVCDEGRRCPALSDRSDCFCATKWNSLCDEVAPDAETSCKFLSDHADCAYTQSAHTPLDAPACPAQYENNGECDAGGRCPCGTDLVDCEESAGSRCPRSCLTSASCFASDRQYCAWYSDYSYTRYCQSCEDEETGHTCSDFADAVEGSCDMQITCRDAEQVDRCPPSQHAVTLTLTAASGHGWDGRMYKLQSWNPYTSHGQSGIYSGSPVSTREKSVYTFTRSLCVERQTPCYRLDLSANSSLDTQSLSTLAPPEHGSQLTWQLHLRPHETSAVPSVHRLLSGGYGSFMIPNADEGEGSPQEYCDRQLCGSGVRVTVDIYPSVSFRAFEPRLHQRWTLVEEDPPDNVEALSYDFPVCEEHPRFGANPCAALPRSGKLQYQLCLQPATTWFRFTYYVSETENVGDSKVSVSLNGMHVLNASAFTSVRYALGGDASPSERSWPKGPVPVDDRFTRGDRTCSCDRGDDNSVPCTIDCSGRCASSTWLGDGVCNDQFNCEWLSNDHGDCYEHWVIEEGRQFNGHPGDWLAFSKDGHKPLAIVAGVSANEPPQLAHPGILGVFSSDGRRVLDQFDDEHSSSTDQPPHTCQPEHQVVLGNASMWTLCATREGSLAVLHGRSELRTLAMLLTEDGRVWVTGAGGTRIGGYVASQRDIGSFAASAGYAPCTPGLQPLLSIGEWKLCEARDKLCWYHTEDVNGRRRDVLKFYVNSETAATWAGDDPSHGHLLSSSRRNVPEQFEPAAGSVTNGVWRAHTAVNGSDSEYELWINGKSLQKSSGDSVAQFTSDCFNSGLVIAISAQACSTVACSSQAALRFSTTWCNEVIGTNTDDWSCTTEDQPGWQRVDFVEDSYWESPHSKRRNAEQAANTDLSADNFRTFRGSPASEWIWARDHGSHPGHVWCRYVRQPRAHLSAEGDLTDRQGISADGYASGTTEANADGQTARNSQVSGYVLLGALLAASVAALTRKFFNQSWQQKLDGELHLGMVVGYEENHFDYSTDNPMSRREDVDVAVAVRQSILNRFGDDHEAIASIIDTGGLDNLSIDSVIGRGARSVVYAAEYMGCRVALKQLQLVDQSKRNANDQEGRDVDAGAPGGPGAAADESAVQQVLKEFAAEVRMLSKLQHPNVIKYVGFTTNPHCLIIQEYAPNGDLRSYLEAKKQQHQAALADAGELDHSASGPLPLIQQVTMALDIARGMEYLHCRTPSVLHRDLKSPNLLVDEHLRIKITDFGLAREKDTTNTGKTGLMTVCGTPLWTAPEILKGQLYNEAADVYSFSLCLWELWAMTMPFHELGLGPMEVLLQVVNDDRRPTMPDEIPPLFADLVVRCWATDARERPNFEAIVAELETFAELSGFGAILVPKSFDDLAEIDSDLAAIQSASADSLGSGGVASNGATSVVASSVFSLESASTTAVAGAQGGMTAL